MSKSNKNIILMYATEAASILTRALTFASPQSRNSVDY